MACVFRFISMIAPRVALNTYRSGEGNVKINNPTVRAPPSGEAGNRWLIHRLTAPCAARWVNANPANQTQSENHAGKISCPDFATTHHRPFRKSPFFSFVHFVCVLDALWNLNFFFFFCFCRNFFFIMPFFIFSKFKTSTAQEINFRSVITCIAIITTPCTTATTTTANSNRHWNDRDDDDHKGNRANGYDCIVRHFGFPCIKQTVSIALLYANAGFASRPQNLFFDSFRSIGF